MPKREFIGSSGDKDNNEQINKNDSEGKQIRDNIEVIGCLGVIRKTYARAIVNSSRIQVENACAGK